MVIKNKSNENESISTDTVAVDSNQKPMMPMAAEMKLYSVPIFTDVQASLTGDVEVYATSKEEAAAKVQTKIDDDMLDDDIEMQEEELGFTVSLRDLWLSDPLQIDEESIEMIDNNIAPEEVLRDDVKQLEEHISWDEDTLAKRKAFLITLLRVEQIGVAA